MNTQKPNFDNPKSPFYLEERIKAYRKKVDLPKTLMEGEDALKLKGDTYLVKRAKVESDDLFKNRIEISNLVNAFQIGVSGWAGRITGQGIELSENALKLDVVNDIKAKADTEGNSLDVFMGHVAGFGLGLGSGIILVDGPKKPNGNLSQKEAKEQGLRPYFRLIDPSTDLLGFSGKSGVLTEFRILETKERTVDNSYQKETIYKARCYESDGSACKCTVYEFSDNEEKKISETILPLSYIPVVAYTPGKQDTLLTGDTPVRGLANLTKAHWNSWSLETWILLAARTPFLTIIGSKIDIKKVVANISSFLGIGASKTEADVKYVEINGKGTEAGFKHIDYIEAAIRQYGVEVSRPTGKELATTKVIDTEKTLADLKGWAAELESVCNSALSIACDFKTDQEFPEGGATVNKEFGYSSLTSEQVQLIKILVDARKLPSQAVFEYVIKPNFKAFKDVKWEDIEGMILSDSRGGETDLSDISKLFGQGDNK